ncbi:MAG: hypothetical protein AM324_000120 [Candidatus Thorarchaeota archaeon SMTZ1-83]|nr:MAG: hypothetical protein AM324_00725 [Candidatus Thorarchaeota archaeon SMTZ1-83]
MDGMLLNVCAECESLGVAKATQTTYPCALCGQHRCETHSAWVPAHVLERPQDNTERVLKLLAGKPEKAWYTFCGRLSHVPRGVPIWYGKEREGGKLVEEILDHEKPEGLEAFPMWEVGIVEDGYEKRWKPQHYELSCDLAATMTLILKLWKKNEDPRAFLTTLNTLVFESVASKKTVFFGAKPKELKQKLGETPSLKQVINFVCSRCVVVACLNRQAEFYDRKTFNRVVKKPESLVVE